MSQPPYTPNQLRAQIRKMWLRQYPDGPTDQNWILQVGIGAGMLDVAADRIEELEFELQMWADLNPDRLARMLKAIRIRRANDAKNQK